MTVKQLIYDIGRKELTSRLGVGDTAISEAIKRGVLPASWCPIVMDLAKEAGVEVPDSMFNWKIPANNDNHTAA
ncbi:MAG: hypothetical protein DHS20C08_04370 [Rhodomicrobium sp.]|nr:MAG: hypothetical protein DHS20C08_04370 [Rhodomicrobium sp.]